MLLPFALALVAQAAGPSAPAAGDLARSLADLPAGTAVDGGRVVSAEHVMWRPRAAVGQALEGWVYTFKRKDGSVQKMIEMEDRGFGSGAEVLVITGTRLALVAAKGYAPPAPAAPVKTEARDVAEGPRPAAENAVAPVTVRGKKTYATIAEARENAIGSDWNKIYCEKETTLGSHIPSQTCLTLRDWDIRNQEMKAIRDAMRISSPSGQILGGAG